MIWLKENDTITSNVIVGDRKKLLDLYEELTDKDNFKLDWAEDYIGEELPPIRQNAVNYVENIRLGHNGNGALGNIYMSRHYITSKMVSTIVTLEALKTKNAQMDKNISLLQMLKDDVLQIEIIQKLLVGLDKETSDFIIKNLWEDFNCFYSQVLDVIGFEKVKEYNMSELDTLKKLSKSMKTSTAEEKILANVNVADNNARILKLAINIRNKS